MASRPRNGRRRAQLRSAASPRSQILTLARLARRSRPPGVGAGQRARARPQRRQRHPRSNRFAGAARQARPRQRHCPRREQCVSQNPGETAAAGPDPGRDPHAQHQRYRPPSRRRTISTRHCAALFIYNHNPIVVHPDQNRMRRGWPREDVFAVGIELTMTESMTHCDVVLPAATHFDTPTSIRPMVIIGCSAPSR